LLAHVSARSRFEPPAAATAASLGESTAASPAPLLTVCERSGYQETGRYDEVLAFGRAFERRSHWLKQSEIGMTPEGRPLTLWSLADNSRGATPSILIQNAAHAGETAGKDATLMLIRDVALGRFPQWRARCNLFILPVLNVDGHERRSRRNRGNQNGPAVVGARVTAQRINLNRDYMKADAPEMRAWLRFYNSRLPELLIDNHTSNGIDFQYDITYHIQTRQMLWRGVAEWNTRFRDALSGRLHDDGHITGPYFEIEEPPQAGSTLRLEFRTPGYSWGYAAAQNRSAIVAESHSLKSYRTQVWAHYDLMRHAIELVCRDGAALRRAVRSADREVAALAGAARPARIFLDGEFTAAARPYEFRGLKVTHTASPITGAPVAEYAAEPERIRVAVIERVRPTVAPPVPHGYAIPAQWSAAIDLLALHGVHAERLKKPRSGSFGTCRFDAEEWDARPTDGRHRMRFRCRGLRFQGVAPAGWIFVPLDQRGARVAMHLLEPEGPESLVRWGFFNTVFDQTEYLSDHVLLPLAERLLQRNAALRRAFEERVAADTTFQADAAARLDFLYRRSAYVEREKNLYPVWRALT
jgi:hypothetical protein